MAGPPPNLHMANILPSDIPELLFTKITILSWLTWTQTCSGPGPQFLTLT